MGDRPVRVGLGYIKPVGGLSQYFARVAVLNPALRLEPFPRSPFQELQLFKTTDARFA